MIDLVDVSIVFSLQYLLDGFDDFDGINNKVTKMYEKYTLDVAISEARLLLTIFCQTWLEVDSLVSHWGHYTVGHLLRGHSDHVLDTQYWRV